MRKTRFTTEQIVGVLHEHEAGARISELCRRHGVTETTFHRAIGQAETPAGPST